MKGWPELIRLATRRGPESERLNALLASMRLSGAFNPSFVRHSGCLYLVCRHLGPSGVPPFHATLITAEEGQGAPRALETVDLTKHVEAFGVKMLADPKLVVLGNNVWMTFNDGFSRTQNHLFLMRITPRPGPPRECLFEGRQVVEKNWAFLLAEGKLRALYSVDPVRVLQADTFDDDSSEISFREISTQTPNRGRSLGLTIGTQISHDRGAGYLIAHEKWHIGRYRCYVGRLVRIRQSGDEYAVQFSRRRLCHSLFSLLGSRRKYNVNLLSCTYFSGLEVADDRALLGYGINDISTGFAQIKVDLI
jgi:hypothetical protein